MEKPQPPPPPPAPTCSQGGLLTEGTLLNRQDNEDGPLSKGVHGGGLESGTLGPVVHEANCDAVVTTEEVLGWR